MWLLCMINFIYYSELEEEEIEGCDKGRGGMAKYKRRQKRGSNIRGQGKGGHGRGGRGRGGSGGKKGELTQTQ